MSQLPEDLQGLGLRQMIRELWPEIPDVTPKRCRHGRLKADCSLCEQHRTYHREWQQRKRGAP